MNALVDSGLWPYFLVIVAGGFVTYFLARRSMLIGVLAGEAIMIAGAYFTVTP